MRACRSAQFYLGTTRLQLEHKGGADHIVTSIANVVPAFGFIGIPVIGWLLDRMGYGITLATINFLGVLASFFQAMPSVWFQVGPCLFPESSDTCKRLAWHYHVLPDGRLAHGCQQKFSIQLEQSQLWEACDCREGNVQRFHLFRPRERILSTSHGLAVQSTSYSVCHSFAALSAWLQSGC